MGPCGGSHLKKRFRGIAPVIFIVNSHYDAQVEVSAIIYVTLFNEVVLKIR